MITYERYAIVFAVLQLAVSGLGFVVVAWTLRVLVRSIDAQSSAGVAARQLEFDKVILTYPVLYKYFYQGQELRSEDAEYPQAMAATQLLANYFDGYFQQRGMYRQMWQDENGKATSKTTLRESGATPLCKRETNFGSPKFVKCARQ